MIANVKKKRCYGGISGEDGSSLTVDCSVQERPVCRMRYNSGSLVFTDQTVVILHVMLLWCNERGSCSYGKRRTVK